MRMRVVCQRKPLSRRLKEHVWEMSRGFCWYCGVPLNPFRDFVVEHVIPLSRGGADEIFNMVPSCAYCNQEKGTRFVEEWRPFFADSMGQGPDPNEWVFWFELPRDSFMPGQGRRLAKYSHEEWRDTQITGYLTEMDCEAQGGC
jgi:hypothetical protein